MDGSRTDQRKRCHSYTPLLLTEGSIATAVEKMRIYWTRTGDSGMPMMLRRQRQLLRVLVGIGLGCALMGGYAGLSQPLAAQESVVSQDGPPATLSQEQRDEIQRLHDQAVALFEQKQYNEALQVLSEVLEIDPGNVIALYNAACAQSLLGYEIKAVKLLELAVLNGFVNFDDMRRDPDLQGIRDHSGYKAIIGAVDEAYARSAQRMTAWARATLGENARIDQVDDSHLIYATQLDQSAHAAMRRMLDRQVAYQIEHFFGGGPNSYVLVMVPEPEAANRIIGSVRLGGFYDHDNRRLVSREIGPSLRHEITHALHHGQMDRLGQQHPMWIQEGLAAAFEAYDFPDSGQIEILANTRINIAINLKRAGSLTRWDKLFELGPRKYTGTRPRARYAESRAIFLFLSERGELEHWYQTYVESFAEDASGTLAFEQIFDLGLRDIERQYRLWLGEKTKLPMEIAQREPALGLWVADQGANDGVEIVGVHPGGAARAAKIRRREVITAMDGKPVYTVEEIIHEVLKRNAGDTVRLHLRRGTRYREVDVRLRPVRPMRNREIVQAPGVAV